jgi:G3E family GTPase
MQPCHVVFSPLAMSRRTVEPSGMDAASALDTVPLTLLTGFLGSGKTSLLRRALRDPAFSDTAVVINEVGEIAIDHYLVDFVEGSVLELPGGCLCCAVRDDLAQTLRGLIRKRDVGEIRRFRHIVVETSGLADPAPILYTFGTDPMLDQRLRLTRVVTLVDAVTGQATLERFSEAARQAAVADVLVVSKTDLAPFDDALAARLSDLNPAAERIVGAASADPSRVLFGSSAAGPDHSAGDPHAAHSHGLATYTIVLQDAIGRFEFALALGGLAQERGNDLLRVKGLVRFADMPDRPAVVQAAQHAMFSPEWLDSWPDEDQRSRLVFIVHDIAPDEILDRFAFAGATLLHSTTVHTHPLPVAS